MAKRVIIEHKDGRTFSVEKKDFTKKNMMLDSKDGQLKSYEEAGFEITQYETGEPYDEKGSSAAEETPAPKEERTSPSTR